MFGLFESKDAEIKLKPKFKKLVEEVNSLEEQILKLSDEDLKKETANFRSQLADGKTLEDIKARAFAVVREASRRTLGQRHYDVQLVGGAILHEGAIAEMKTGEGKTLMATLAIYLNALEGRGVHAVTVNEYLAKRDTAWMGQIYDFLGMTVTCLVHEGAVKYDADFKLTAEQIEELDKKRDELGSFLIQEDFLRPVSRREAYQSDLTYGTNHEFGFDYLRDNLARSQEQQVQMRWSDEGEALGARHFAIIDEVDSVLIDEARTPLIISAPDSKSSDYYKEFSKVVSRLEAGEDKDYEVDEKQKAVSISEKGIDKVEKALGINDLYSADNLRLTHYLQECLKAYGLFHRDQEYVVKNGEVVIVDQFTGRMMPGRRYSGGLHQAIEAKEGVAVKEESRTYASVSIQNYFRLYTKLSGMTGTAQTSAEEFHKVYELEVENVPTHRQLVREDRSDLIYKSLEAKYKAIAKEAKERSEKGQPVLIGTVSIDKNEELGRYLNQAGVKFEMLNAKNNEKEGTVIAQAGRFGAVTVATNMAGRGVDIILGGNPAVEEDAKKVKELGGLHVIGTERHESRRIDNQLRGRAGRQGDPGSSQFFLSMEDDLMRVFGGERIRNLMQKLHLPDDQPIQAKMLSRAIESSQSKVESHYFEVRKHLLEYDDVMNKQRLSIYDRRQELLKERAHPEVLATLDTFWMEHLEQMDALRESVRLRAVGQKDPLVEYRREGHEMFRALTADFDQWMEENKERIEAVAIKAAKEHGATKSIEEEVALKMQHQHQGMNAGKEVARNPVKAGEKVGRNDPCPCGAKKSDGAPIKYKHCHGG
ncbi:MAG: preprotein translocase subunit SecA [Candidatus Harrisonbacteria bacterium CG10_big_fil_rev_8_21_14_0_10_44_23]|uniref:Protein translocase subunit SecA n=1 Tax=Candidatus Harrisonbacteria bacterium CG10_big_fil_rev_8_21_14_0_10_44_23 TaxID=1974585 RepID=A0A2H0UPZ5_9BACT|nr:MAG: preprotein translocase subunit SecA [Candidatus Harrisonbacteria bacterium CG10_big_fil_rev_8_21_14_0_10_44_23]